MADMLARRGTAVGHAQEGDTGEGKGGNKLS